VLALLRGEPGADTVRKRVDGGAISSVNWSEVHERVRRETGDASELLTDVQTLGVTIVPFTVEDAECAAALRDGTRHVGLSVADRACLALATRLDRPALTTDRAWLDLDVGVRIESIR